MSIITAYVVAEDVLQLEPDVGLLRRARGDFLGNLGPVGGDGDALPAVAVLDDPLKQP